MNYHKNPPVLTIKEEDAEFVVDKIQDRGENIVIATEAQREKIMEKLVELHDILHRMQQSKIHHPTMQHKEKQQQAPVQKEQEETMQTIVKSSDRFKVTHDLFEVDINTAQQKIKDIEHLELVLTHIPTKELYGLQVCVMQKV
jgi:hypothetical protein